MLTCHKFWVAMIQQETSKSISPVILLLTGTQPHSQAASGNEADWSQDTLLFSWQGQFNRYLTGSQLCSNTCEYCATMLIQGTGTQYWKPQWNSLVPKPSSPPVFAVCKYRGPGRSGHICECGITQTEGQNRGIPGVVNVQSLQILISSFSNTIYSLQSRWSTLVEFTSSLLPSNHSWVNSQQHTVVLKPTSLRQFSQKESCQCLEGKREVQKGRSQGTVYWYSHTPIHTHICQIQATTSKGQKQYFHQVKMLTTKSPQYLYSYVVSCQWDQQQ